MPKFLPAVSLAALLLDAVGAQLLWTSHPAAPPRLDRVGASLAFDATRGRLVAHGGVLMANGATTPAADTWEWDGSTWTLAATAGPSPLTQAPMAYASSLRRVVLIVDGVAPAGFTFDGVRWEPLPGGAPPRGVVALVDDERRARLVAVTVDGQAHERVESPLGSFWQRVGLRAWLPAPPASAAYDHSRGVTTVVVAPRVGVGGAYAWDGVAWAQLPSDPPPFAGVSATIYDRARERIVVQTQLGLFERAGARWLALPSPSTAAGCARQLEAWGYDAARGQLAVLGAWCGNWSNTTSRADFQTLAPRVPGTVLVRASECRNAGLPTPRLTAHGVPILGNSDFALQVEGLPNQPGFLLLGASARVSLGGCTLFVAPTVSIPLASGSTGLHRVPLPIPLDALLRSLGYSAQAGTWSSAPLTTATSSTLTLQIGD